MRELGGGVRRKPIFGCLQMALPAFEFRSHNQHVGAADDLRLSIVIGLRVARSIAEHLENSNWKIERGPPAEGHGQYIIPPRGG